MCSAGIQFRHECVVIGSVTEIDRVMDVGGNRVGGDGKIRRSCGAREVNIACSVQRDGERDVLVVAAKVRGINQVRARRAQLGYEHIPQTTAVVCVPGVGGEKVC